MQVGYGGAKVPGRMHILSHLDPTLCTSRGAALGVVEEGAQVRVERGACEVGP